MGWIRNLPSSTIFWLALVAIVLVCSIGLPAARWEWLRSGASEGQSRDTTESTSAAESSGPRESNSTTVRNIGFIVAGVLALVFAVWRGVLAQRQAETAQRQSETSQQGLLNERYQKGAEMLGSEVLSVRLGGIYALQRLAEEHPQQYHVEIMQLFCAFVRSPTGEAEFTILGHYENGDPVPGQREDVQAVMNAIDRRTDASISLEEASENFHVGLQGVKLQHAHLAGMNLSDISFGGANLSGAVLEGADLSDAWFISADLSSASLLNADLSDADLSGANLSDAMSHKDAGNTAQLYADCCRQVRSHSPADSDPRLRCGVGSTPVLSGADLTWRRGLWSGRGCR